MMMMMMIDDDDIERNHSYADGSCFRAKTMTSREALSNSRTSIVTFNEHKQNTTLARRRHRPSEIFDNRARSLSVVRSFSVPLCEKKQKETRSGKETPCRF